MPSDVVAITCVAFVLLGQIGRVDARFDAINFALPYLSAVGLLAALSSAWRARTRLSLFCAAAIVAVSAPLLAGEWTDAGAACGGPILRLVQHNAFKDNADPGATARRLVLSGADVIVLEEGRRVAPLLAPLYPWRQSCGGAGCSTIILSRMPPVASGGAARGDPENRGALSAAWMRLPSPAGEYTVIGVHLGRPWPFRRYRRERRQLVALVARHGGGATIVAGDFNLPGWTFQMHRLETAMGLTRLTRGLASWPAQLAGRRWPLPLLGIDHVLAGPEWRVAHVAAGAALGSDHRPVSIELERCGQVAAPPA